MEPRQEQPDEVLCCLASGGDRDAEEQLVNRYIQLVRICARPYFLVGGDSEDLIQEGMIGLVSAIRGFQTDKETRFRTYAETCIRNRIRSALRAAARDKHSLLNQSVPLETTPSDVTQGFRENPEDVLIGREESRARMKGMQEQLSGLEKTVLELYLDGLSCGEIARRIHKPIKSVDNAVQRIRRKALERFS